jgi:transcriptional regulator with XRE-family HTH domain
MRNELDIQRLATMTRAKRGSKNLREAAAEIGDISPSTLSRVENEKMPDMETFLLLCNWLEASPAELFRQVGEPIRLASPSLEQITVQLRADKTLDPATANVLATLVSAAYEQFGRKIEEKD